MLPPIGATLLILVREGTSPDTAIDGAAGLNDTFNLR